MDEKREVVENAGIYSCPICRSKKITIHTQTALLKHEDANTGKEVDEHKNKIRKLSNREKAAAYDMACVDGVGCWNFSCRKCGWESKIHTE